ncbi:MAG: tRNA-uridine aminocarboxypropyltransferase [Bacteriovorax sp.]|nr:tRNA-uridine aminocarboxypropyltransferase [Bacteriovorax sp.]
MDKITYQKLKAERLMAEVKHAREEFCFSCIRIKKNCLCHLIKPFNTDFHFVLLLHPMEAKKEKMGTGRISKISLLNSQLITGVDFSDDDEVNSLINNPINFCLILYPGKNALNVSEDNIDTLIEKKKNGLRLVIFLIDGTWPCAKKMMRLSKNLQILPRISFSATHTSIFEIKEQPADFCLSTLESIHFFIQECNRRGLENTNGQENTMMETFKEMISFQIKCSLDPELSSYTKGELGYSKKEDRIRPKKWLTRNIVLAD